MAKKKKEKLTCDNCPLSELTFNRSKKVMGEGGDNPKIMFVGEALGETEDRIGRPFVGPAGRFLRDVILQCEFDPDDIYITNVVKCRPPNNKLVGKFKDAIKHCYDLLEKEINERNPDYIVALGATALSRLIGKKTGIASSRGKLFEVNGRKILATYHPSYVAHYAGPVEDRQFESDMEALIHLVNTGEMPPPNDDTDYSFVEDAKDLEFLLDDDIDMITVDLETNTSSPYSRYVESDTGVYYPMRNVKDGKPHPARILCVSFSWEKGKSVVAIWNDDIAKIVKKIMESDKIKIAHNAKFEYAWFRKYGIEPVNLSFDTMLYHYLTDENTSHGLKDLCWNMTDMGGYEGELEEYISENPECNPNKGGTYANVPPDILLPYNCSDTDCTIRIAEKQLAGKYADDNLLSFLHDFLLPASLAIARVEENGFTISVDRKNELMDTYTREINKTDRKLKKFKEVKRFISDMEAAKSTAKEIPNWRSSPQMGKLLMNYFKFEPVRFTDTGAPSWNKEAINVLESRYADNEFLKLFSRIRRMMNIKSTFLDPIDDMINTVDGRLHCNFILHYVVTGRLSSRNPNMQNLPTKETISEIDVPSIKTMYVSRFKKGKIIQADYSQIELRIIGMLSGDPGYRSAFERGYDIHRYVGSAISGTPYDEVTKAQRYKGKRMNFAIVYGQTVEGTAEDLNCSVEEAKKLHDDYGKKFPRVRKLLNKFHRQIRRDGFVRSPTGRIRRPKRKGEGQGAWNKMLREAANFPIQNAASDLTLSSILCLDRELREGGYRAVIIGTVHDSVIIDCPKDEVEDVVAMVKYRMEHMSEFWESIGRPWIDPTYPIRVDIEIGDNLGDISEIEF